MFNQWVTAILLLSVLATACSTMPKSSLEKISQKEAESFLSEYCSKYSLKADLDQDLFGEILVRSSTKEFKGQYPASIHFSKDKSFTLEVTNLIGGTVAMLKGDPGSVEVFSPSRPQYNRKGIKQYMGLSIPLFAKLLHGDLPCPDSKVVNVEGYEIIIKDSGLEWRIERSDSSSGSVPVKTRILEQGKLKVEMLIEGWNSKEHFAEKVKVHTSEGDLKWSWRSRELK